MKRAWIFIALLVTGMAFIPQAYATTFPTENQSTTTNPSLHFSSEVKDILQRAAKEASFSFEELSEMYDRGMVKIEDVSERDTEVRVMSKDGNPIISIFVDNF